MTHSEIQTVFIFPKRDERNPVLESERCVPKRENELRVLISNSLGSERIECIALTGVCHTQIFLQDTATVMRLTSLQADSGTVSRSRPQSDLPIHA